VPPNSGFEGVVSKTIDAPYVPGNRGLWRKAKALNRQEFVVVGWSDPEGSRPHLGALLLGYYADEGKLTYAGRVGTGMPDKVLAEMRRRLEPLARAKPSLSVLPPCKTRFDRRSFFRASIGRAEARRGDHLSDLDGRQPSPAHGLRRAARGQAGQSGAAGALRVAAREKPGPPMTLGNMRQNGVRAVIATCQTCGHKADVNADPLPETIFVPDVGRCLRCSPCGGKRIDTRPAWHTR
jgi:ATP dependent DNA ligase C terminal region